ncbi:MAG: transglycosylase SLT domain-containing protein, partial [archaeon]|nr:transglycosylase SLT domain-containing protein [archaeon]
MKTKLIFGLIFILIFLSFASAAYTESNSRFTNSQQGSFFGTQTDEININSETCQTGQDFLIQIAPGGCSPPVVRSDLLEEQNVPVFCKLQALKINPAVRIVSIDSVSFGSDYPRDVSTIAFFPTYSALGLDRQLTGSGWNDIGYAVIYLRQNPDESSIPEFVSGNLKARIRYSAIDAFGSVDRTLYLPLLSDDEFDELEGQYAFFNQMGYLRADEIGDDFATIDIYSGVYERALGNTGSTEKQKILSRSLDIGETSSSFFLPGFGCFASSYLRLDKIEGKDTRAVIKVNSEVFEIKRGETFLNGICSVTDDPEKEGLRETVKISCRGDEKRESFILRIEPTINLSINGAQKEYKVGDYLYNNGEYSVYLGYVGTTPNKNTLENSLVYLVTVPGPQLEKLDDGTLKSVARVAENTLRSDKSISDIAKSIFGVLASSFEWLFDGNNFELVQYGHPESDIFGASVEIKSFGVGTNLDFGNQTLEGYYGSALKDYEKVKNNFGSEKYPEGTSYVLGEKSLKELIDLSEILQQREDLKRYCDLFKTNYPDSKLDVSPCEGIPKYFNDGISSKTILIGGDYKQISFEGISKPEFNDYGIEITVRKGNEVINEPIKMTKGDTIYLDSLFSSNSGVGQIYSIDNAIGGDGKIYFQYYYNIKPTEYLPPGTKMEWLWSADQLNWMDASTYIVNGGAFDRQKPTASALQLISQLKDNSYENGKEKILGVDGNYENKEFIKLNEILDSEHASLQFNIQNKSITSLIATFLTSTNQRLEINSPHNIDGTGYVFIIDKINLKKVAKVSIHTEIRESSEVEFNFNVGIEKRSIQLSPDQIRKQIEATTKLTNKLESISNSLSTVVDTMQNVCVATGAVLTLKNLIFNSGTESLARTQVMNGERGWYELCNKRVNLGEYGSVDECLFENSGEIETQIDQMSEVMSEQNERISNLESQPGVTNEGGFLEQDVINQEELIKIYSPQVSNGLPSEVVNPDDTSEKIDLTKAKSSLTVDRFKDGVYNIEDAREIELYSKLKNQYPNEPLYEKRLYTALYSLQTNSDNIVKLNDAANIDNINSNDVTVLSVGKDVEVSPYSGKVASDFSQRSFTTGLSSTTPVQKMITTQGDVYYAVLEEKISGQFHIKKDDAGLIVYSENGVSRVSEDKLPKEIFQIYFQRYDSASYSTPIKDPEIKYYETEPYKGLPAVIPFDVDNGWYAYIPQTTTITQTRSYDDSARINSFWLCNAGSNGLIEYNPVGQDEICELFNLGTGQLINQFPGLESSEASVLVRDAVRAIETASRAYRDGVRNVNVNGKIIEVGTPALDLPTTECTDVMSPTDCQILFNACDPVICPSSRCDFGGDYPVRDVIQSGIIGSVALCLPNWNEGIYVPVCLTGVKAGIDGFISVTKSYSECLKTSLDEGKTVGICDEIYSIYGCELIWRTALPLVKLTIPKIDSLIFGGGAKGGGEYVGGVQGALDNAKASIDFFTQNYAINSYDTFKARSQEEVGTAVCKNFVSVAFPQYAGTLNTLTQADSPPQFTANFEVIPFSSATNPPQVHYKVFFHIFAGNNVGAYYQVYLKTDGSSFYQNIAPIRSVDSDYIPVGEYETKTLDFTGPEGYTELCVRVNNQEECGFGSVTTDFALNYLKDQYIQAEANSTDITTQEECISGGPNLYNLLGLNVQEGVSDLISPSLYNEGITRVCSTDNPGSTDEVGNINQRWIEVGYCGGKDVKCWIDKNTIARATNFKITADQTLESLTATLVENLKNQKGLLSENEFSVKLNEIENEASAVKRISLIELIYDKVFENNKKGYLLLLEGNAFGELSKGLYSILVEQGKIKQPEKYDPSSNETITGPGNVEIPTITNPLVSPEFEVGGENGMCYRYSSDPGWQWKGNCLGLDTVIGTNISNPDNVVLSNKEWKSLYDPDINYYEQYHISIVNNLKGVTGYTDGLQVLIDVVSVKGATITSGDIEMDPSKIFDARGFEGVDNVYFEYSAGKWTWSFDKERWTVVPENFVEVSKTVWDNIWDGLKVFLGGVGDTITIETLSTDAYNLVKSLEGKDFITGAAIIFSEDYSYSAETQINVPASCSDYYSDIKSIASEKGVDPYLVLAIIIQESNCNPSADSGSSVGLMQINSGVWCGQYGLSSDKTECER